MFVVIFHVFSICYTTSCSVFLFMIWTVDILDVEIQQTTHARTHAHTFNGPFSGTTWVSRYKKGKTDLDFTEARDSEWQWHQLGHMQVCI